MHSILICSIFSALIRFIICIHKTNKMHYNVYDVFYSQFSHNVSAAVLLRPKHVGEKIVNEVHHKHCSALCWLFMCFVPV